MSAATCGSMPRSRILNTSLGSSNVITGALGAGALETGRANWTPGRGKRAGYAHGRRNLTMFGCSGVFRPVKIVFKHERRRG